MHSKMAHHHHQLTAHSQLTTLSPAQIQYLQQFPAAASVLPPASGLYHDSRINQQHGGLRTPPGTTVGEDGCLICLQPFLPRIARGGKKPYELFSKACELLQVPIAEIHHEWNFGQIDKLPFCGVCTEVLEGLIMLYEQLDAIQRRLNDGLNNVRQTIQDTSNRVPMHNLRTGNFRTKALKYGTPASTTFCHYKSDKISANEGSSGNIATDFLGLVSTERSNILPHAHDSPIPQNQIVSPLPTEANTADSEHSSTYSSLFSISNVNFNPPDFGNTQSHSIPKPNVSNNRLSAEVEQTDINYCNSYMTSSSERDNNDTFVREDETQRTQPKKSKHNASKKASRVKTGIIRQRPTDDQITDVLCEICMKPLKIRSLNIHKFTHMNSEEKNAFVQAGFTPPRSYKFSPKRFQCTICEKQFVNRQRLRAHEMSHLDSNLRKKYKCQECFREYTSGQSLKEHVILDHHNMADMRKMICNVCGKMILSREQKKHMLTHLPKEDRPFVCKICGARVGSAKYLRKHEAAHDAKKDPAEFESECDICGKRFGTFVNMKDHRRKTHKGHWKLALKIPVILKKVASVDLPDDDGYLDDLNNEGLQHIEGPLFSYQLYQVKQLQPPTKGYQCCTCLKEFVGEGDTVEETVKTHIKLAHIGSIRCNICSIRVKNLDEMLAHKRNEHTKVINVNCEVCMKPGILIKNFKRHLWLHKSPYELAEAINGGESLPYNFICERQEILEEMGIALDFDCVLCDLTFPEVELLHQHRISQHPDAPKVRINRKIEGNRGGGRSKKIRVIGPVDCPICGKTFGNGYLRRHLRKVHNKAKDKPLATDKSENPSTTQNGGKAKTQKKKAICSTKKQLKNSVIDDTGRDDSSQSESDPEYTASISAGSSSGMTVTLRDRSKLRQSNPRSTAGGEDDNNDEHPKVTPKFNFKPVMPMSLNVEDIVKIEYIYPETETGLDDDDDNASINFPDDIKLSPQSSNDYDSNEEDNNMEI